MSNINGVENMIREFSEDFNAMKNEWKYIVRNYEDGIEIEYWERKDDKMIKKESMIISACCAELLFKTIAKDFENENIKFD